MDVSTVIYVMILIIILAFFGRIVTYLSKVLTVLLIVVLVMVFIFGISVNELLDAARAVVFYVV